MTSYRTNPPEKADKDNDEPDPEAAEKARKKAHEALDGIGRLVHSSRRDHYREALTQITRAIRLSGGPTPEDEKFIEDLFEKKDVRNLQKEYLVKIDKSLKDGDLSSVQSVYPQLSNVDYSADELRFFSDNKSAAVKELKRSGSKNDGAKKDDDE